MAHVPVDVLYDVIGGAAKALIPRRLIRLEMSISTIPRPQDISGMFFQLNLCERDCELRLIVEHLFKVGDVPGAVGRVPRYALSSENQSCIYVPLPMNNQETK